MEPTSEVHPVAYQVSLNDARRWIANWKAYEQSGITVAYMIRNFELTNLIMATPPEPGSSEYIAAGVRVYYAMGDHQEPKTLLVAVRLTVDGKYADILDRAILKPDLPTSDIYDFSSPCPPTCDLFSPLYNA